MSKQINRNDELESKYGWWALRFNSPYNNDNTSRLNSNYDQHPIYYCSRCDKVWNSRRIKKQENGKSHFIDLQTNYSAIPKSHKEKVCCKCIIPSTQVESY
jgi:hypothetical protein